MELYFLRHGRSIDKSDWDGDDDSRPLSESGKTAMAHEAATLVRLGLTPEVVVTSPLARARETAEIVATGLETKAPLETDDRLSSGFGLKELRKVLRAHPDAERLMLVGHEPDISQLIGKLTGARVEVTKGGLARVDLADDEPREGTLVWLWQGPELAAEALAPPTAATAQDETPPDAADERPTATAPSGEQAPLLERQPDKTRSRGKGQNKAA